MNLWFRRAILTKRTGRVFLFLTGFIPVLCLCGNLLDYAMQDQTQSDGFHAVHNNDPALLDNYVGGILGYDYTDQFGFTLLMRASQYGARKNVTYLLDRGADRHIRNWDGKNAYDLAKEGYERTFVLKSVREWTKAEKLAWANEQNKKDEYRQILSLLLKPG
jgi:hypothetical protein